MSDMRFQINEGAHALRMQDGEAAVVGMNNPYMVVLAVRLALVQQSGSLKEVADRDLADTDQGGPQLREIIKEMEDIINRFDLWSESYINPEENLSDADWEQLAHIAMMMEMADGLTVRRS